MKQFRELLIIIILILVAVWLVDLGVLDGIAAGLVQQTGNTEPHITIIQPIQGEPALEPTATLPALPAMGPYTYEQYQECHKLKVDGRLHELPKAQFNLCSMYTED